MWLKALSKQGLAYIKKVQISPYRYFWRPTITEMPGAQVTKQSTPVGSATYWKVVYVR
jgi:hypothetical protein